MRYVSRPERAARWNRPRADDFDDFAPDDEVASQPAAITVYEPEDLWTGLIDASGNKIYREREPIGFRFSEQD